MSANKPVFSVPPYSGDLPIHGCREAIIEAVNRYQVVIIAGETGSGKTTQLPKYLVECGLGQRGKIGCTQPRRVAALSVAQRIAEELKRPFGNEVGAKIRFTDKTKDDTVIKVMTDGILLNEIQEDPSLSAYDAILIDEAHERSLNIDFILGFLRLLIRRRPELKVVITSATIDTEVFSKAFDQAPVFEVSGRMYPVRTHYRPIESLSDDADLSYIEGAQAVIAEILEQNRPGDILVFLPSERDIHELKELLGDKLNRACDVLPLYGRLANADQQRIFHPGHRRRIILSTNIAETSLTVPGIRFVVDSGLARISRYSPHSRTQRLPIEPIAQASADQRKGRCGRVADGICYRLYSEADYEARPRYATPEMHRSNLASVILRMLAFKLGNIATFPFIDPPEANAIRGGYRLLSELGAIREVPEASNLDSKPRLTRIGRELARIPIDPTIGRMLIQARREGVLDAVLIIASGLSIRDPRERPAEMAKEADAMQARFVHPESDFVTLWNIWQTYHDKLDSLSQSKLRRFCREHFLSYQRMREWRDLHHQLDRILKKPEPSGRTGSAADAAPTAHTGTPDFAAVHRSILAGLLSNIAVKDSGHAYRGPRNRKAMLFPGSALFDSKAAKTQRKAAYAGNRTKAPTTRAPEWIVCGEWMETSRVFARTAAQIEIDWIEAVAKDMIRIRHSEPFWSEKQAAALCRERHILFGLELRRMEVNFSRIDPASATDLFVRKGLVEEGIRERPGFLQENAKRRLEAASELARRRQGSPFAVEDRLFDFYRERLEGVGSYADLRRFAKERHGGDMGFLQAAVEDLLPDAPPTYDGAAFPRTVRIGGEEYPLHYRDERGHHADGVTLRLPVDRLSMLQEGTLDWAVPGLLEERIEKHLRQLPKAKRVQLHPLRERAAEIRSLIEPDERPLAVSLSALLESHYGVFATVADFTAATLPAHLKILLQVTDNADNVLHEGRDLSDLRERLRSRQEQFAEGRRFESVPAWQAAARQYERENLTSWDFGNIPLEIDLSGKSGLPLKAFPGLVIERGIHLRLFPNKEQALAETETAWPALGERAMGRDLAWVRKDLKAMKRIGAALAQLGPFEKVLDAAWSMVRAHLFRHPEKLPLRQRSFDAVLERAARERRTIVPEFIETLEALMSARQEVELLLERKKTNRAITYPGMRHQLVSIAPSNLLDHYAFEDLPLLVRFLRAMIIRAERAKTNLQKDIEKAKRVTPYESRLAALQTLAREQGRPEAVKPYLLMLEAFKVSIFAQELGAGVKVSEKRLDALEGELRRSLENT